MKFLERLGSTVGLAQFVLLDQQASIVVAQSINGSVTGYNILHYVNPLIGTVNGGIARNLIHKTQADCSRTCLSRRYVAIQYCTRPSE